MTFKGAGLRFEMARDANERQRLFDHYLRLFPFACETGNPVLDKRFLFGPPHLGFSTHNE